MNKMEKKEKLQKNNVDIIDVIHVLKDYYWDFFEELYPTLSKRIKIRKQEPYKVLNAVYKSITDHLWDFITSKAIRNATQMFYRIDAENDHTCKYCQFWFVGNWITMTEPGILAECLWRDEGNNEMPLELFEQVCGKPYCPHWKIK
jgi:hypothetical protein